MGILGLTLSLLSAPPAVSPAGLPVLPLYVRSETLWVEVASTPAQRMIGLMYRDTLPDSSGMLFVFEVPQVLRFWMKNTWIPLDIAFVDEQGIIVDIQAMDPMDTTLHISPRPVPFALEVNRGWFERHGIGIGDTLKGPALPR